jgi:hypothetical protein
MENSTVANLIKYFNIASIAVLAVFAALGAAALLRRFAASAGGRKKQGALLSAFCVAALAAFAAEATLFNYQSYLKPFAGPEIETLEAAPGNPQNIMLSNGATAELFSENSGKPDASGGLVFKNLNEKVASIYVDIEFRNAETKEMTVSWTDEANTQGFTKKIYKRLPRDNYAPLYPCGKVSELKVTFKCVDNADEGGECDIAMSKVALNRRIPVSFSGLRIAAATLLLFAAFAAAKKEARARAAYYLLECKFNPASRKQNAAIALAAALLMAFSYVCVYASYPKSYTGGAVHQQYNKYLVDALENGRTWLDFGTPENLLKAERPYDNAYRMANGYKFGSDVMWDWAWYKGKFYCYYGVVPAVILYLPYKLMTGEYLSNAAGIFLFTAVIIFLMAALWRFCVRRYMPNAGFAFVMLSFLTLFFASGIFAQLRFNRFYSIVQVAGLMFALAGCLLLLKSVDSEKVNRLKLFFACLCFALIAGCRPNMVFVSLLLPFALWKYRSWKLFAFAALPFAIVAVPLCAYNYARFGSVFEFGVKYTLGGIDNSAADKINAVGRIVKTLGASAFYLFNPNKYSLGFPYVECFPPYGGLTAVRGIYSDIAGSGMANFPIVFCLPYIFKVLGAARRVALWFIIAAAAIIAVDSYILGFQGRYMLDFAAFLILPALFCAYSWCGGALQNKNRRCAVLALLAVSIFVGSFLFVSGTYLTGIGAQAAYDHTLYRYLECSLGGFGNV